MISIGLIRILEYFQYEMIFRSAFLISTFIFLVCDVQAQIIRGQVGDYDTKEIVPFANIYFSATMQGTTSDQDGFFELSTEGYYGQDIVISSVGYDSWIIKDFQDNKFYKILLKPSARVLREVVILSNDLPRKKKEKMFLQEFLGITKNASKCHIENMDDVILTFFKSTKTLEAYCFEPLLIYNESLGYKIKYFLASFMSDPNNMFYQGNFLFEEIETSDQIQKQKIIERRKKAYYGSRMHFFRVLWNGDEGNTDYYLQTLDAEQLGIDSLVLEEIDNLIFFTARNSGKDRLISCLEPSSTVWPLSAAVSSGCSLTRGFQKGIKIS